MPTWPEFVEVAPAVADALAHRRPVVALESAVISHGLPHPTSIQTAVALENIVRGGGAVPATIAVLAGRITVGLPTEELDRLMDSSVMKVAARDLPVAVATKATGGTTVSATITAAHLVGIQVVSTGGIGGVHVDAEPTWDVSADLPALACHPIAVVCAGAKAICDVKRTLEYLDTTGVTVVAYRTDQFPYFYARDSGLVAPRRIDTPDEAAAILAIKHALGQRTGLLIATPVPEAHALPANQVRDAVRRAAARARAASVRGADLTPFLLATLTEITGGQSLQANLALLRANAELAAAVAHAVAGRTGFVTRD